MIRFIVGNEEIILPDNFSFQWRKENPHISDKGEFSLDITASLLEPKNAKAFKFLNRINNSAKLKTANARLIENGKAYNGTINVIESSDIAVTFQFLSGNSEFKFLTANSKKIWQLDFGSTDEITVEKAIQSIQNTGYSPTNPYVCSPIKCGNIILNDFPLSKSVVGTYHYISSFYNISTAVPLSSNNYYTLDTAVAAVPVNLRSEDFVLIFYTDKTTLSGYQFRKHITTDTEWLKTSDTNSAFSDGNWSYFYPKFIMQPYLMYYIYKIPELFGYTLKYSVLNDDNRAKIIKLNNTNNTVFFSDCLPDMSVSEFIFEIEKFFNIKFEVNSLDKSISLVRFGDSILSKSVVKIEPLNGFIQINDVETINDRFDFTKLSYDVDSDSDYFAYQKITDENLDLLQVVEFNNMQEIKSYFASTSGLFNLKIIYKDLSTGYEWFVWPENAVFKTTFFWERIISGNKTYYFSRINKFKSWGSSNDKIQILSLIPSQMVGTYKYITYQITENGRTYIPCQYQLPVASTSLYEPMSSGFQELIESLIPEISRTKKIEVSLYTGKILLSYSMYNPEVEYPFSHVDRYPEFNQMGYDYLSYFLTKALKSLSLVDNYGIKEDYGYQEIIDDVKTQYKFILTSKKENDINNIFEFENREYLPIVIDSEKQNNIQSLITAICYRLK